LGAKTEGLSADSGFLGRGSKLLPTTYGVWKRCELPLRGSGQSPDRKKVFYYFQHSGWSLLDTIMCRVVFVRGSRGTSPSLDLTFLPTGLSENLGGMERGREGKGKGKGGETTCLTPPTGFCLKYHPDNVDYHTAVGGARTPYPLCMPLMLPSPYHDPLPVTHENSQLGQR